MKFKNETDATKKLRRLKVNDLYCRTDAEYESEFDRLWWAVLHEYDMYIEGHHTEEDGGLNKATAKTTYKWLKDSQHLTKEFKDVKY